jgi:DNA-binding CsgD family transcriptional regulator/ligand-binding sensor domain-containing protein
VKLKTHTLFFLVFLGFNLLKAQEIPPIENYYPEDYKAENQNWSISQTKDNYIYIANNKGLLEYNGANWQLYPSPNNTIIRAVKVIGDRIYTGSYMEFGYWQKDIYGHLQYTSLSNNLKEPLKEDEQFWNIIELDNWILFQSLNRIYIFNTVNKSFKVIESKTLLTKIFKVNNHIYFQKINDGIYKIEKGKAVLVTNDKIVKSNTLVNIFYENNALLIQTQNKGFYSFKNDKLTSWNTKANSIISKYSVYSSLKLKDGSFALGTISNGVVKINKNGNVLNIINQEKGLINNTVLSMFEDTNHNLWLGLDNGISVINYNSPFSVYNDLKGNIGTVYASIVYNGNIYLGTNQGLFYKKTDSNEDFKFIKNTNGQVWCLKRYYNTLFCGHNLGTFIIKGNSANLISTVMGTWDIKPIKSNPNLLMQGNYDGLTVLIKENNKWKFRNKLKDFDISSKFFDFISDNELFVSHEYKGVFKLKLDDNYTKVLSYKTEKSIPKGLKSSIVNYNNNLYYTYKEGVFKYNKKTQKFSKDKILTKKLFDNDTYLSGKLIEDISTNTLWGFTNKSILFFSRGELNEELQVTKISIPSNLRKNIPGYENLAYLNNRKYLFGTSNGYVIIDLSKVVDKPYKIKINSIDKSTIAGNKTPVKLNGLTNFSSKENSIYFKYSVPDFDKYEEVNYQYKLEGLYDGWSNWTTNSEVSFKNLSFGDYTFIVKAQIGNKYSINNASYSFTINRPWFISNLFIAIYVLLLLLLLYTIHILYKRHYTKQKKKLLEKQQQQFTLSQLENDKVIMKLRNDQLRQEVQSKTRELSASTMNIIKKNEILNTIKDELLKVKDNANIKPVITIINKHLSHKDDWNTFQKAFNNADSDFLKKIKSLHPNLTPNDLKLCAYLRLNLSSKAIAPLLNISPRSVEIKRYRLRKKMDLSHSKSLVEYILQI